MFILCLLFSSHIVVASDIIRHESTKQIKIKKEKEKENKIRRLNTEKIYKKTRQKQKTTQTRMVKNEY